MKLAKDHLEFVIKNLYSCDQSKSNIIHTTLLTWTEPPQIVEAQSCAPGRVDTYRVKDSHTLGSRKCFTDVE